MGMSRHTPQRKWLLHKPRSLLEEAAFDSVFWIRLEQDFMGWDSHTRLELLEVTFPCLRSACACVRMCTVCACLYIHGCAYLFICHPSFTNFVLIPCLLMFAGSHKGIVSQVHHVLRLYSSFALISSLPHSPSVPQSRSGLTLILNNCAEA